MPQLPNGRGLRVGEDSFVNQQEAFASRAKQLPGIKGGVLSPQMSDFLVTEPTSSSAYVVTKIYVIPLSTLTSDVVLAEARLRVNTLGASSLLDVALYQQEIGNLDKIVKIPQSEVQFDCTTTGLKTGSTARVILKPGPLFFMACAWRNAAATVTTAGLTVAPVISIRTVTITSGAALPDSMLLSDTPEDSAIAGFPLVVYLSNEYAEFL